MPKSPKECMACPKLASSPKTSSSPVSQKPDTIPTGHTPGLFKHASNSITFTLVVDDFLIKYTDKKYLHHLTDTLKQNYELTMDTKAEKYCGMTINWNYEAGYVDISMPGYVNKALQRFTHPMPKKHQPAPSKWVEPQYGASIQYAEPDNTYDKLSKEGILRLQEIIGTFLYYRRAVDNTSHVSCSRHVVLSTNTRNRSNYGC
jgi:hypothetical protein